MYLGGQKDVFAILQKQPRALNCKIQFVFRGKTLCKSNLSTFLICNIPVTTEGMKLKISEHTELKRKLFVHPGLQKGIHIKSHEQLRVFS